MKILNLSLANIRKSKSSTMSLFIFILVAALLLNMGLMVITQINAFYDSKVEQLKDPHVTVVMNHANYQPAFMEIMSNYPGITQTELEKVISLDAANFNFGKGELSSSVVFLNADAERTIGPLNLIEQSNKTSSNDIFLPYSFKTNGGYGMGDNFSLQYHDKDYEFKVAGFFEVTMMGTINIGTAKFMLPEESYRTLKEKLGDVAEGIILSSVLDDKTESTKVKNDIIKEFQLLTERESSHYSGLDIELVKSINTLTINIVATILVAFAAIIVLVSLLVIRFRVSNNIEDGMGNIGALKAIGYTSRQIISSIIMQYFLIALCASLVGIALSYALMPVIGDIISTLSGLIWIQKFDFVINLISMFIIAVCVVIITLLSAFRVQRILPVAALRGGIQTHSFRKNHFPLEAGRGGLHFLLAAKSMLVNAKQNMMILIIIVSLTFASIFSVVLYYNIASDKTSFVNLFGSEPANVYIAVEPDANTKELLKGIEEMNHVRKVNIYDLTKTNIDGQTVYTNVTDSYADLENEIVFEGRQPKFKNEISISWVVAEQINKGIGDSVEVEFGNEKGSYLVTGLSQSMGNLGQVAGLTMEGIQQLHSEYKGTTLNVYLDGISNKEFIRLVQQQYGNSIVEAIDIDENIESQTGMYTAAVFAVMLLVLTITVVVVMTILYLVIKTMVIKRKKEFGVMKAIGYSNIQLMNQISISFLPVVLTGIAFGGLLGYFFTNPMLASLLSSAGVKRLDFIIHLPSILFICMGILLLAYMISMFVARGIKKISAYGLIAE